MQEGTPSIIRSATHKTQLQDSAIFNFLGEARCIVNALKQMAWLISGKSVRVYTDYDNSLKRFDCMKADHEVDVRVLRLFSFLLGNFAIRTQVTFHHVGGTKNKIAN